MSNNYQEIPYSNENAEKEMILNMKKEIGMYIHIPFCAKKCAYCDFSSFDTKQDLIPQYISCLLQELQIVAKNNKEDFQKAKDKLFQIKTIYIGGGTPSFLEQEYIEGILETIKENYEVKENAEITIEVNPGTVTQEKLEAYYNAGVNRISIGLQTTHSHLLQTIGRIHTYYDFIDTYRFARQAGFKNINIDLMLGLPNQTVEEMQDTLEEVISLEPEHISVYSLILEEGTKLQKQVSEGVLKLPTEQEERKMYWNTKNTLEQNGYIHYEISNFAKRGYEAKHNLDCWDQKEYIGFGSAAHSYTNGTRYSNTENVEEYIQNMENKEPEKNFILHEKQTREAMQKEFMLLGLRKIEGVYVQDFKNRFIANPIYIYHQELESLVKKDLLEIDGDCIKLTKKGLDFANLVWEEFV